MAPNKHKYYIGVCAIILAILFLWQSLALGTDPIPNKCCQKDFECGSFQHWDTQRLVSHYSGCIVSDIVRYGTCAARFEIRQGDKVRKGYRAELKDDYYAPMFQDIWYGFSTYIPLDFPIHNNRCVIAQWHAVRDPGEVSRSPVLAHRYKNGEFMVTIRHSSQKIQTANDGVKKKLYRQKNFPKGVWHDFVYHVRWSYKKDGFVRGWLNGKQIIDYHGPVGYNDAVGPYFKFGLYRDDVAQPYVIYHDEYRRGNSYEEVAIPSTRPDTHSTVYQAVSY